MSDWLYPLSSSSGFWFELPDGTRTRDTSPSNFERSVLRPRSDDIWTVANNYRRIRPRDSIWVYYGHADGDLGVVGLGSVVKIHPPVGRRADVEISWDKSRTRTLLVSPLPAVTVRRYVWPRSAVADLKPHSPLVRALRRQAALGGQPDRTSNPTPSSTITYSPPRQITVYRRHDAMISPVRTRLETCGWRVEPFDIKPKRVDLSMRKGSNILLAEFKTVTGSTAQPVRDAFAQLKEYAWRYRNASARSRRFHLQLWAVLEKQPTADEVAFLEAEGVLVSWANRRNRRINHAALSRSRLARVGVAC